MAESSLTQLIMEWQNNKNTVRHVGLTMEKKAFYSVSLLEMWFPVCIGLMLPFWMNEIPLAQNIMSVCVRTASRLVESLAPVKKKTWTVLKLKMEPQLINYIFYVDFIFA